MAFACVPASAACPAWVDPQLSLTQATQRLLQCNREILLSEHGLMAAGADVQTADRGPNPTLTVGTAYINPQSGIGPGGLFRKQVDLQARIDQTAERGNKRGLRVALAEQALQAGRWSAAETRRQQQLALATAWIDLWSAQERIQVMTHLQTLYQRTQDSAQTRLRAGDIAANDLLRISVDTQRAAGDVQQAGAERARAQFVLASLLALETRAAELAASNPWPIAPLRILTGPMSELPAIRPDLQAARAQLAAAQASRELARSQRVRDLNVGVQLEHYPAPAGIGNSISVSVSMPLFVRHAYEGEIARAEADYTSALMVLGKLEQQALGEGARLAAEGQAAAARAARFKTQLLPLVEKMAANAELSYKKGAGNVFDLLDALKQLRQLQLDALAAQADYEKADAALQAATLTASQAEQSIFSTAYHINPSH